MISAVVSSPGGELEPARQRDEGERRQQHGEEEEALARARNAAPADERRHRGRQLHQAANEWDPGGSAPLWHLALVQLTGARRERPVVLADDHDAVRTGHPAEPRQGGRAVCACENVGDVCVHLHIVAEKRPSGECRTAYPV